VFIVCLICSISDLFLIFLGIFLFEYFKFFFNDTIELIFNIILFIFLIYFIINKLRTTYGNLDLSLENDKHSPINIILKTLSFTYLNPHVYSDTVFFLGNFSKDFSIGQKYYFGFGASFVSLLFFFLLGYSSQYFSKYLKDQRTWRIINFMIIFFMSFLTLLVLAEILKTNY
jgi:L-lysine exporter family protein LysE/ArgO